MGEIVVGRSQRGEHGKGNVDEGEDLGEPFFTVLAQSDSTGSDT